MDDEHGRAEVLVCKVISRHIQKFLTFRLKITAKLIPSQEKKDFQNYLYVFYSI